MKNTINYFYGLFLSDIHHIEIDGGQGYYFDSADGGRYVLVLYDGDMTSLRVIYSLHLFLLERGRYVHQIVLNKDGQIVTLIDGLPYVLLKVFYDEKVLNEAISSVDVWKFSLFNGGNFDFHFDGMGAEGTNFDVLDRSNWGKLWAVKNDHLEFQVSQIGKKYVLVSESFSYFIGLSEIAIQLVNELSLDNITKIVTHRRIGANCTFFDLYNPLNFVIDVSSRDMAEFFKGYFFGKINDCDDVFKFTGNFVRDNCVGAMGVVECFSEVICDFLSSSGLAGVELILFLARMIYPSYYFDMYEEIVAGRIDDGELKKIIDKVDDYETVLRAIYRYCKTFFPMLSIDWLE